MTNGNGSSPLPDQPTISYCAKQGDRITKLELKYDYSNKRVEEKMGDLTNQVAGLRSAVDKGTKENAETKLLVSKTMGRLLFAVAMACLTLTANVVFWYLFNVKLDGVMLP